MDKGEHDGWLNTSEPWLEQVDHVVDVMETDPAGGLTDVEVTRRFTGYGPNDLVGEPPVPTWRRLLAHMRDPLVVLLLSVANLMVADASLTGESETVAKSTDAIKGPTALGDRTCMVFGGTAVTRGTGRAIVTATGMSSETGQIVRLLADTQTDPTRLRKEIGVVGRMLGIALVVITAVVVVTVLLISDVHTLAGAVTVHLLGVSLAVAAVPEGLPAVLSIVLAIGVQRMAARNAIVKNLSSVETLGSASVICSDKTGTLTENQMTLVRVITALGDVAVEGAGYAPEGSIMVAGAADGRERGGATASRVALDPATALGKEVVAVLSAGAVANDAVVRRGDDGAWTIQGDPTEAAFLVAERKLGTHQVREERYHRVAEVPFTSERKLMSTVEYDGERTCLVVMTKGAPDVLLHRCTRVLVDGGEVPQTDEHEATVVAAVAELSDAALRTLGVAYRVAPDLDAASAAAAGEDLEHDLVWCGVVGIIDPPRPAARDAVAAARRAGIRVMMITGDHPRTALRIATDLGIVAPGATAVTGLELDGLDEDGWRDVVRTISVFARVSPEHRLQIVDSLQAYGEVVVLPLLATQILWINLLTDSAPALAMGVDPQIDDMMARPPRGLADRVIDRGMWADVMLMGLVMALVSLFAIGLHLPGGMVDGSGSVAPARTSAFSVLVFAQMFNAFNARSARLSVFRGRQNRWLWGAVALSVVLQIAVVNLPFLNVAFGTEPLNLVQWLVCAALASAVLWVEELRKLMARAHSRQGVHGPV